MAQLDINGNWTQKKNKLQQNFSELTDNDLDYVKGEEDKLVSNIQQRLEIPKEVAEKVIRYS